MLLNILNYFLNTREYSWISKQYAGTRITDTRTDIGMGIGRIFIQQVGYGEAIMSDVNGRYGMSNSSYVSYLLDKYSFRTCTDIRAGIRYAANCILF